VPARQTEKAPDGAFSFSAFAICLDQGMIVVIKRDPQSPFVPDVKDYSWR